VPPLTALCHSEHTVSRVYTRVDRKVGRGQKMEATPVKIAAEQLGIPVTTTSSLKDPAMEREWRGADLAVVVAYGQLLPESLLHTPRLGSINVHASLLPRWRGAAPIQRAIMNGDTETGISIMRMEAGLDTGAVYSSQSCLIGPNENSLELTDRLAHLGAAALLQALPILTTITPVSQLESAATYAAKITKADAPIDWTKSASRIHNQIRGLKPWPVAETAFEGEIIKIHESMVAQGSSVAEPGTIVDSNNLGISVATGDGLIVLTKLQKAGRSIVAAQDFVRGLRVNPIGLRLGES